MVLLVLAFFFFVSSALANPKITFPINTTLEGPESIYTSKILELATHWKRSTLPNDPKQLIQFRCLKTPGKEFFIGAEQRMDIMASLSAVDSVVSDADSYQSIFPGFVDIHVVNRSGKNRYVVYWEHSVPLFFIPNIKYETVYLVDKSNPNRIIYRYKLRAATSDMRSTDGIIVLEAISPTQTLFTEFDFWDSDYGILKTIAPGRIWKENIEGLFLSDAAIKIKSENPSWPASQIVEKAKQMLQQSLFPCGLDK